jgi:hypothetical protein
VAINYVRPVSREKVQCVSVRSVMLHYAALRYSVTPHYALLCYITLFTLYYAPLHCITLCYTRLRCSTPLLCHITLHYALLRCSTLLCYATLRSVMLYYAALRSVTLDYAALRLCYATLRSVTLLYGTLLRHITLC